MPRLQAVKEAALSRLFFCSVACLLSLPAQGTPWSAHVEVQGYASSRIMAIKPLIDRFEGDLKSGQDAVTRNQIRSGGSRGPWTVELLHRFDYEIEASRDFVEGYHALRNKSTLDPGRRYALSLEAWHVEARGARVARAFQFTPMIALTTGFSLLEGRKLLDGALEGSGIASDADTLDYQIEVSYAYSRDVLFKRPVSPPSGTGASMDLGLEINLDTRGKYRLQLWDAWGRMRWRNAPGTEAVANTDRDTSTPENGLNPLVSGREFNQSFTQHFRPYLQADAWLPLRERYWVGAALRGTESLIDLGISGGLRWGPDRIVGISAYPSADAAGITATWGGLKAQFVTDDLKLDRAAFLLVQLGYRHHFD